MNVVEFQRLYELGLKAQSYLRANCLSQNLDLDKIKANSLMNGLYIQVLTELGGEWFSLSATRGRSVLPWPIEQATKFYTEWMTSPNVRSVSGSLVQNPLLPWFDPLVLLIPGIRNYYYDMMLTMNTYARVIPISAKLEEFVSGSSFMTDDVRNFVSAWAAWKDKPTQISHKGGITGLLDNLLGGSGLMEKYGGVITWVGVGIGILVVMGMFNKGGTSEERR